MQFSDPQKDVVRSFEKGFKQARIEVTGVAVMPGQKLKPEIANGGAGGSKTRCRRVNRYWQISWLDNTVTISIIGAMEPPALK